MGMTNEGFRLLLKGTDEDLPTANCSFDARKNTVRWSNGSHGTRPGLALEVEGDVTVAGMSLLNELSTLKHQLVELSAHMNEVYNAPGMPGFEKAHASFQSARDSFSLSAAVSLSAAASRAAPTSGEFPCLPSARRNSAAF